MKHVLYVEVIKTYVEPVPFEPKALWFRLNITVDHDEGHGHNALSYTLDVPSYVFCDKVRLVRYMNATWQGTKVRLSGLRASKHARVAWWLCVLESYSDFLHSSAMAALRTSWYDRAMKDIPVTFVNGVPQVEYAISQG